MKVQTSGDACFYDDERYKTIYTSALGVRRCFELNVIKRMLTPSSQSSTTNFFLRKSHCILCRIILKDIAIGD